MDGTSGDGQNLWRRHSKVCNHLRTLRKKRGISASHLAWQVGIARQTIYAVEAGNYTPNISVALDIARALDVRVDELFVISNV